MSQLAGLLPGTLLFVAYFRSLLQGERPGSSRPSPAGGFWLLAGVWCVFFFSCSGSKLPTYILPAYPFLCLALGEFVARSRWDRAASTRLLIGAMAALVLWVHHVGLPWYAKERSPYGRPELVERFVDDPGTAVSLTASLLQETTIWAGGEIEGPLRERAEENIPTTPIPAPVLIAQGEDDAAIPLASQDAYTADRCGEGWELDYRTYPGLDHLPLVEPDSEAIDDVFVWTAALFSGEAVPPGSC